MNYNALKELMHRYRIGKISRLEMKFAIGLWQLKINGEIACK